MAAMAAMTVFDDPINELDVIFSFETAIAVSNGEF